MYREVGLNKEIFDIKLCACNEPLDVISNRETLTRNLVKNKASTSDGCEFKLIVMTMKNGPDLLDTTRFKVEDEEKEAAKKVSAVNMKGDLINKDAIAAYNKFLQPGRPHGKYEHSDLDKQEFTAIIKFLLNIFSPNEYISLYYSSKPKAK